MLIWFEGFDWDFMQNWYFEYALQSVVSSVKVLNDCGRAIDGPLISRIAPCIARFSCLVFECESINSELM